MDNSDNVSSTKFFEKVLNTLKVDEKYSDEEFNAIVLGVKDAIGVITYGDSVLNENLISDISDKIAANQGKSFFGISICTNEENNASITAKYKISNNEIEISTANNKVKIKNEDNEISIMAGKKRPDGSIDTSESGCYTFIESNKDGTFSIDQLFSFEKRPDTSSAYENDTNNINVNDNEPSEERSYKSSYIFDGYNKQ